jgi:hypothetical protein
MTSIASLGNVATLPNVSLTSPSDTSSNVSSFSGDSTDVTSAPVQLTQTQSAVNYSSSTSDSYSDQNNTASSQATQTPVSYTAVNPNAEPATTSVYNALAQASASTIIGSNINIQV